MMAEEGGGGGVTVCVRVRPLIARENEDLEDKTQVSWKSEGCTISQIDGIKSFIFDRVFHSEDSTTEVYQGVAAPIIKSAVRGYNGTIFAYGQTASGKTYTMLGTQDRPGILPMAINDVFNTICRIPDREFLLRISYMEIHNESIQDLLCSNIRKKKPLVVREDINRTIYVEDLSEEVVISPNQVLSWLQKGEKNRHYGETKMNERSSRSHTIFRMIIESKEKTDTSSSSYEGAVMVSHLNLVDLAGSERASQTGSEGIRFKEGCNINRSLFILGQVIKKLCDDQSGGYISYRDSKLTRILQNSLGGNAKTVIICTVTPVSLEETLSTLQFASTAKKMKNTPKINEVLDDEALLKRYRKEIEELKRRLGEVSSHSPTKHQLAQLLEEKNSLQKQQQDRIRALTEMLVTSSSFLQDRELKARRKRRVTWAPGVISQDGATGLLEEFPSRAKHFKASSSSLAEMEESLSSEFSEFDDQSMAACAAVTEEGWIPGPEINFSHKDFVESVELCETLVEEKQAAKAELESLQLEKEQLACELSELREKLSTYEFVALEKETAKEQEMQQMHEISSLKALIANAEVYNQDLQEEINSKNMQTEEQENKIQMLENRVNELQNLVEELKTESGERDVSFSVQTSSKGLDEMRQMKQSLDDAEVVALDAKKESSFLRSENLALKEKMSQLSETYSQMEKDVECCRSQLEAGKATYKKMQTDLQKELQYYFQENAKLTSLLEGKVPKDLLSCMELERKVEGFKNELNKALEENAALRKEAEALSEAASRHDLEIVQEELLEKSETIALLTSEREHLLSQVAEKERMLHEATDALKSKEDPANAGAVTENAAAFQEPKHQADELAQKSLIATEESNRMKGQVDFLSGEHLQLNVTMSSMTRELSSKIKELQEKDLEQEMFLSLKEQLDEAHQKLGEMEPLKDQLKAWESKMEAVESEKLALAQRLQEGEEEMRVLIQEQEKFLNLKEQLDKAHQKLSEMEPLKDQLKAWESKTKAAESEKLALAQGLQEGEKEMRVLIQEQEKCLSLKEQLDEAHQKLSEMEQLNDQLKAWESKMEAAESEKLALAQRLQEGEEEMRVLIQEQEKCLSLKEQLDEAHQKLSEMEQLNDQLKAWESKMEAAESEKLALAQRLQEGEEEMRVLIQEQEKFFSLKEQLDEAHQKLSEMEPLKDQLKAWESKMEAAESEKLALAQGLQEGEEEMRVLIQERDDLKQKQEALEQERDQIKEDIQETVSMNIEAQEELRNSHDSLKQCQNHIKELEETLAERDSQILGVKESLGITIDEQKQQILKLMEDLERFNIEQNLTKVDARETVPETNNELQSMSERIVSLEQEKTMLQQQLEALQQEKTQYLESHQMLPSQVQELQTEITELDMKEQLRQALGKLSEMDQLREQLKAGESRIEAETTDKVAAAQKLQQNEEAIRALIQEKDDLRERQGVLETERDQISDELQATRATLSLKMQELQDKESELEELLGMKEQLREAQWKWSVAQQLEEELKARESELEAEKVEKLEMAQRLRDSEEERKGMAQERDALKAKWEAFQTERETLKGSEEEATSKLEEKAFDLLQQLELREEQSQQDAIRLNEMEQQKVAFESKMAAMQREQAGMVGKLHSTAEDFRSVSQENKHLKTMLEALQAEKDNMSQTIHRLGETVPRTFAANLELQEQLRHANCSLKERNEMVEELREQIKNQDSSTSKVQEALKQKVEDTKAEMEKLLERVKDLEGQHEIKMNLVVEKDQLFEQLKEKHVEETERLKEEFKKLSEELNLQIGEKNRLLAEQRGQTESMEQLAKENSLLHKERNNLQQTMQSATTENDELRKNLLENSMKLPGTNAKVEQQDSIGSLEAKVLRITEALEKFPVLEKRSEHLKNTALQIKSDLDSEKAIVAKGLAGLPPQQANNVKRLQAEHELISEALQGLLNKVQFLFTRLCKGEGKFFTNITNYTRELLQEGRKQHELLTQIQHLKKHPLEQHGDGPRLLSLPGLSQNLDVYIEQILKDVSKMEETLLSIEEKSQQLGSGDDAARRYLERCSVYFNEQDFEAGIKSDNERLLPVGRFLKPLAQVYIQDRTKLETRNAEYCRETEAALKACKEQTKELLLELNSREEQQKPCGLEEENYKLGNKLKATEQDMKSLKLRIQELENTSNEAGRNLQEKEKRIATLEMELKVRASRSEVARLQATLDEKENCLRNALLERQTLKAQLDKGAALYKDEIEDLQTQLAKADMARMKQSKYFDQEMANAKALAELRDEKLRKLKEELRKVQQEQDATVISGRDPPQTSLLITCGGGSGIVQNTQVLLLKSEHAKLESNYKQLKKDHELLLTNELVLKEEAKKWKERALRRRDKSSRDIGEEQRLRSPRKTAPPSFLDVACSPSKESALKPVLPMDTPPSLPLNHPTRFFANPCLGTFPDTKSEVVESTENNLKHWMATANQGDAQNCKIQ